MNKIYYLIGKSSSGKDSIYKELINDKELDLKTIVGYTTRPIREGETEGKEYHFVTEDKMNKMEDQGLIIEKRSYNTVHGIWNYFTAVDDSVNLEKDKYLLIGTLEAYMKVKEYYGEERVCPLYIEVEDGERLQRALNREKTQKEPKYAEMCRRFLADQEDFSDEKLANAGIIKRYKNVDMQVCINEIKDEIKSM